MKRKSSRRSACVFILLMLCALAQSGVGVQTATGADTERYGQVFDRTYTSSVDGALLPCSIYLPAKTSAQPVPVWVDLHALNGPGGIRFDYAEWGRAKGWVVVSPWGRNFRSLWADGVDTPGAEEPCLFDQFSGGMADWRTVGGTWSVSGSELCQTDQASTWKGCVRTGSAGSDYTVSVDLQQVSSSGDSAAMGMLARRQSNGDCYWIDIADVFGKKYIRLFRYQGGAWTTLACDALSDTFDMAVKHNLKVMFFGDTIQVRLDGQLRELDTSCTYHLDKSERPERKDTAFRSGEAGLCSYGGSHRFDNFRVQNELLYGERDLMDTIDQVLEDFSRDTAFRVDMNRIYISGFSIGGSGAWSAGLHYPDLFAAIHPGVGETDIAAEHRWLEAQRPDQAFDAAGPAPRLHSEQDYNLNETTEALYGGAPGASASIDGRMREFSGRWILENGLNTPVRIEHPKYDTIVPNSVDPVWVWWSSMDGLSKVTETARADYAHSQYVWDKLHSVFGLTRCRPETANFGLYGEEPSDPAVIWDCTRYDHTYQGGGHGCCYKDWLWPEYIVRFFERATVNYGDQHRNPTEIAYKTYDSVRNRAWWLKLDIARPDSNVPGLARVERDTAANTVTVHAKNVRATTLDLPRMGISTSPGKRVTLNVDRATIESEPLADASGATDLNLLGAWDPAATYTVRVNGATAAFTRSATALSVPGVRTSPASVVTIDVPACQPNMLANPGFESGLAGWQTGLSGGGQCTFEMGDQSAYVRSGERSLRVRDASPAGAPYAAECRSARVNVLPGKVYTASAAVMTRALRSRTRSYAAGRYSTADSQNARALVGLVWMDANGTVISRGASACVRDTNAWTPLEVSGTAPAGAAYAQAACMVESPDASGTTGSAWFDDVSLVRGYKVSGSIPAPASVSPESGTTTVDLTVNGTGFQSGATLKLRRVGKPDVNATIMYLTASRIVGRVNLAGAAEGPWDVEVCNPNGERGTLPGAFVVGVPMTLTGVTPSSGVAGMSVSANITGTGFKPGATVRLEKDAAIPIDATAVTVQSATTVSCTFNLAAVAAGAWDLVLTNPDGQVARLPGAFTVNPASAECGSGGATAMLMLGLAMGLMVCREGARRRGGARNTRLD